jgi:O-antigen/teichoic acid export membrane protein
MSDALALLSDPAAVAARPSLTRSLSWLGVGNVVRGACQWGMISALAKLGNTQMVGQYALGLAVTAPLMLLACLQLNVVQVTDSRGEFSFGDYLSLRCIATSVALLAVVAVVVVSTFHHATALVIVLVAIAKAIDSIGDVFLSAWQQVEEMRLVAALWMANSVCSLLLLTVAIILTGDVAWAVGGSVAGSLFALGGAIALVRHFPCGNGGARAPHFNVTALRHLVVVALPVGGVGALLSLNANVPRYFVQHYLGESALGLFAAAAYPMVIGDTVVNSLAQSASPRLAHYHAQGNAQAFKSLLRRLTLMGNTIGFAAVAVVVAGGREIMTVLYRPDYASQAAVFVWIVVAVSLRYSYVFIGVAVTAMRHFRVQLYLRIGAFVWLMLTSAILIKSFGLIGAAAALVTVAALEGCAWLAIGYFYIWKPEASRPETLVASPSGSPAEF